MSNDLLYFERQKLQYYLRTKQSLRAIAKVMRRTHSVLSKEIKRYGSGNRNKYRADVAQRLYEKNKHKQRRGKLDKYPKLQQYVEERLKEKWSPEQIAGRLKVDPPEDLKDLQISHESIYFWIYEKAEKYKLLHKHLRTHRSKRRKQGKRKRGVKVTIPSRISIHDRPNIVDIKQRIGDWETDTVEFARGKKNPFLSVQYERKTQLVRMHKMKNKTAEETKSALVKTIESVEPDKCKTITFDNGSEGVKHVELQQYHPNLKTYFCDTYSSWQKGGVENMNKLIRQYLPRTTNMHEITQKQLKDIENHINNRPRKGLNYRTPNEVFYESGSTLT